jgi:hypothetical protein
MAVSLKALPIRVAEAVTYRESRAQVIGISGFQVEPALPLAGRP